MQIDNRIRHPVVLFDGQCSLCNGMARFLVRLGKMGTFHKKIDWRGLDTNA